MDYFLIFILTAAASGVGSYLGAYLRKKGENLATHEDVDKLLVQVSAVTQTTKEIEAKISNEFWERQRRWETKKEVLFNATKELGSAQDALSTLHAAFAGAKKAGSPDQGNWAERPIEAETWSTRKVEAVERWQRASLDFSNAALLVMLICNHGVREAINARKRTMASLAGKILQGDLDSFTQSLQTAVLENKILEKAIRQELKIDDAISTVIPAKAD